MRYQWTAVLLLAAVRLWAQGEAVGARLSGTVMDADESSVPVARVTLASPETGFARQFVTDDEGNFIFPEVPPGRYQLRVEKEGFSTFLQSDVVLTVGQSTSLNPKLELGALSQVIEVTAGAPLLNSGNANIGEDVTTRQAVELPLNIRNVYNLVELSSSVNNNTEYQGLT
jgi:Carboxypeptidase regulatory-like domain